MELCSDPMCAAPGSTVYPVLLHYSIDYSYTPSPIDDIGPTYDATLSFGYYGGSILQQAVLCNNCTNSETPLAFGAHTIDVDMRANTVYELALNVQFDGMGTESFTFDPTFSAPPGAGTLIYSPLVTGGVPEPVTWTLLIAGFGIVGTAARRRRVVTV